MWSLFAIAAGAFYTTSTLLNRRLLVSGADPWILSFYFSTIGAIVSIPFIFVEFRFANTIWPWLLLFGTAGLIVLHNLLNFRALKHLSASIHGTFYKLRLVWSFLLGVTFLQETWAVLTLVGVVATVSAGALLLWQRDGMISRSGVVLVLVSSIVNVVVLLIYKILFQHFGVGVLTFFIFFIPALMNAGIIRNFWKKAVGAARTNTRALFAACALGGFANLAMNQAIALGEVTGTLVIIEACLIFILAGEHLFLKETSNVLRKTIAVVLATIGAACILII